MQKYIQLKNQIEKLQKEAEAVRKRDKAEAVSAAIEIIRAFELTAEELGFRVNQARTRVVRRAKKRLATDKLKSSESHLLAQNNKLVSTEVKQGGKKQSTLKRKTSKLDKRGTVAPKYRDSVTGFTWSGRGKQPKWLSSALRIGKKLEDYKI